MTTSQDIRIRVSSNQKQRLIHLAEASGHKTLSDYCRYRLLEDQDISLHAKLNEILKLLKNEEKGK